MSDSDATELNADPQVVEGFGAEWSKFRHVTSETPELRQLFASYFAIFPWKELPPEAEGFDLGCGTGRWAYFVAPRVGRLHCIDASVEALNVALQNLKGFGNCDFHLASVGAIPLADSSADFGYSLGVLHHVPDTPVGIAACVRKLKPGAPFLVYLYYAFDNRPWWFRLIWRASDFGRRFISNLPFGIKSFLCEVIAAVVYLPLARISKALEGLGVGVESVPLSSYRNRSFYIMRTDALDRFGTRLEKRFTQGQIRKMMEEADLEKITFSKSVFWCAVGYRRAITP
jgi:SAM-dependent methyltransferase